DSRRQVLASQTMLRDTLRGCGQILAVLVFNSACIARCRLGSCVTCRLISRNRGGRSWSLLARWTRPQLLGGPKQGGRTMGQRTGYWRHSFGRIAAAALLLAGLLVVGGAVAPQALALTPAMANSCQLSSARGDIHHVIYIQFDNTHFRRDNPN